MEANFCTNINNVGFKGLKSLFKERNESNISGEETRNVEQSAQNVMSAQGRAFVEMQRTKQNKEEKVVKKLTDEEFEQKKKEILEKINGLPDELKQNLETVQLNKNNIFVAEKLLERPEVFAYFGHFNTFLFFKNIESLEEADLKCKMADKIFCEFGDNENVIKNMYQIISVVRSQDGFDVKCQIINKISKILNNNKLNSDSDLVDFVGNIIRNTYTQEEADIKCKIIDKVFHNRTQHGVNNLGKIASSVNNNAQFEFISKILHKNPALLCKDAAFDKVVIITNNINSEQAIPLADKILKSSLEFWDTSDIEKIGSVIKNVDSNDKLTIAKKILDLYEDYFRRVNCFALSNLVCNAKESQDVKTIIKLIELSKSLKYKPEKIEKLFYGVNENCSKYAKEILEDEEMPDMVKRALLCMLDENDENKKNELYETYNNNVDKIKELLKNGYELQIQELQNSENIDFIFENETSQVRLNKKGVVSESKCEEFILDNKERLERTTTADNKYACDAYYDEYGVLTKEIRVVNGKNGPLYVQKTVASPIMEGVYDTTVYNLIQTDKNADEVLKAIQKEEKNKSTEILEEIEKAGIKGWDFAKTVQNPDGTKTHIEKFQKGELHTNRTYTLNYEGTKTSLDYTIANNYGKKILSIHRTFELDGDTSISTINGKEYLAEFDDKNMMVKIGDIVIDFKEKMKNEKPYNQEKLWHMIKKTPADLILKFSDIENLMYEKNNGRCNYATNTISSEKDIGVLSHEIGHYLDETNAGSEPIMKKGFKNQTRIRENKELIQIYNEEIEDFKKNISEKEQEAVKYFSQNSSSSVLGLGELIAETNMLCTTQTALKLQARILYLTRYFPKTMAKAAELLGYSIE